MTQSYSWIAWVLIAEEQEGIKITAKLKTRLYSNVLIA